MTDTDYRLWFDQLKKAFAPEWQAHAEGLDYRDPCWREAFDDGLTPQEVADVEMEEQAMRQRIKEPTGAPVLPALMDVLLDDYRAAIVAEYGAKLAALYADMTRLDWLADMVDKQRDVSFTDRMAYAPRTAIHFDGGRIIAGRGITLRAAIDAARTPSPKPK